MAIYNFYFNPDLIVAVSSVCRRFFGRRLFSQLMWDCLC